MVSGAAGTYCNELEPVITFLKSVLTIIQWAIPIMLIVMGSIDLGKAVLSSDDKEIKAATGKLIKRAIAAVAVFFVSTIVSLLIGMVGDADAKEGSFVKCWADNGRNSNT